MTVNNAVLIFFLSVFSFVLINPIFASNMRNFLKKYIPFSMMIGLLLFGIGNLNQFKFVMQFTWLCFALFFMLGLLSYYFSAKSMKSRFANFMNIYFAGIIIKLIVTGIVVLAFKSSNPDTNSVNFVIPFAIIYFSFLFFETIELVKLSKKSS